MKKPTSKLVYAILIYVAYLTVFFALWIYFDVDYLTIGQTSESSKLHYALPTLAGGAIIAILITLHKGWKPALFDTSRSSSRWAWLGPIGMFAFALSTLLSCNFENASSQLILWTVLGGLGVGFGEEMITRGTLLVAVRHYTSERQAWLISTIAFSGIHVPNALFGLSPAEMGVQLLLTFMMGSLLYATRRLSGNLLMPMFLHGFWDSSVFLARATGGAAEPWTALIYPISIFSVSAVVWADRKQLR